MPKPFLDGHIIKNTDECATHSHFLFRMKRSYCKINILYLHVVGSILSTIHTSASSTMETEILNYAARGNFVL